MLKPALLVLACVSAISFTQQAAEPPTPPSSPQGLKPITDISDLEAGMPIDYVFANLQRIYNIRDELAQLDGVHTAPRLATEGFEVWVLLSNDPHQATPYVGELAFRDGKLWMSSRRIWSPGQGENELVDKIFTSVYDNSGQSEIKEGPGGNITRTRDTAAILQTQEVVSGKFRKRGLTIRLGEKVFDLSVTADPDGGGQQVTFDEVLILPQSVAHQPKKPKK